MRGTQSLLRICAACWQRPSLLAWEVLWRWSFGIPALALVYRQASRIAASHPLNVSGLSLSDPVPATEQLAASAAVLTPAVAHVTVWLGPLLVLSWAVASGLGRAAVLKRLAAAPHPAHLTLILLQLLQVVALVTICLGWYHAIGWAANATLSTASPNIVGYSAWVICLSLGTFVLWALLGWIFSIAPVLAVMEGKGVLGSLARSLRLGPWTGKLVEVNLVLGIVRLALIVLAMVFSAIPLPFEADMTGTALYLWWAFVTVLYLVANDFFQVARLAAFIEFSRFARQPGPAQFGPG